MKRERIDKLLVERGLVSSRTKAQAMIMAGAVLVEEQRIEKPSDLISVDAQVRIKGANDPAAGYVGRGGVKLEAALRHFAIDVQGLLCLDIGASTGGFTDCLLQHGAGKVFAIDVGHNQLDWSLRNDPRVETREGVNARYLKPEDFASPFELATMDVSFISATKVLPAVVSLLTETGRMVTLIKPQFEVGRGEVGRGGIVSDPKQHARVVAEVNAVAAELGLILLGVIESPIQGAEGNREFLAAYQRSLAGHVAGTKKAKKG
ncbi:MAG: rRNA (cytidine1920-2-O)/16S rRNA (cytidine1409-2-O)-methyltransferase [Blastocatellia bacterium]|jgi:23S rRNA (cytidine1920-2'-O)/16S rRNA (cytidine1409-2'-O)-methyltransferase|nr:rRNA (cytidine1920-2-O)/16S rRNA (cytidine1409-2-O)-methyltransferase [Blastocatellia bacterium]